MLGIGLIVALLLVKVAILDPQGWLSAARAMQPAAVYGEQIELLGAQSDESSIARGATLHVRFFWRASQPVDKDYHVFAQLFDAAGQAVAGSDKQHPGDPVVQGESPTTRLAADKYLRDEHRIDVPATLAPGRYELRVGWYDPQTGKRLRLANGETTLGVMTVDVQ